MTALGQIPWPRADAIATVLLALKAESTHQPWSEAAFWPTNLSLTPEGVSRKALTAWINLRGMSIPGRRSSGSPNGTCSMATIVRVPGGSQFGLLPSEGYSNSAHYEGDPLP